MRGGCAAGAMLARVTEQNRCVVDQGRRVKAIEIASRLHLDRRASINGTAHAVHRFGRYIRTPLEAAAPVAGSETVLFKVVESEEGKDVATWPASSTNVAAGASPWRWTTLPRLLPPRPAGPPGSGPRPVGHPRREGAAAARAVADACRALEIAPIVEDVERTDDFASYPHRLS